jgi:hypothetical protein
MCSVFNYYSNKYVVTGGATFVQQNSSSPRKRSNVRYYTKRGYVIILPLSRVGGMIRKVKTNTSPSTIFFLRSRHARAKHTYENENSSKLRADNNVLAIIYFITMGVGESEEIGGGIKLFDEIPRIPQTQ